MAGTKGAVKFGEQFLGRFAEYIGQHIEPAPVCHADANLLRTLVGGPIYQAVEQRNQAFGPLQSEALGTGVATPQIVLQLHGSGQAPEQFELFLHRAGNVVTDAGFQLFQQPFVPRAAVGLMGFYRQGAAVGLAQHVEQGAEGHRALERRIFRTDRGGGVHVTQAVGGRVQFGNLWRRLQRQRVEIGGPMPVAAISPDQRLDAF